MANTGPYGQYQADMGPHAADPAALIMGITPVEGDPNGSLTVTIFPAFAYDTIGNTLYETNDGSTWVAVSGGGGGGTTQVYRGHGAPVSTPTNPAVYYDLDSGDFYVWYTSNWEQLLDF